MIFGLSFGRNIGYISVDNFANFVHRAAPFSVSLYSQNYAVLNIVGIIIIINSVRIRAGVILQRYRKHYCVTYSHNISCFVRVLGGFHMRVAVDAAVDVEKLNAQHVVYYIQRKK